MADDAVAEAFTRAMESRRAIRSPASWLYRTAFRIAARELRRHATGQVVEEDAIADPEVVEVMEALRRLTPAQRAAAFLHYEADLPVREVARLMGSTEGAVRVHLHRARRRLRELLGTEETDDA